MSIQQFEDALLEIEKILEDNPGDLSSRAILAKGYFMLGRKADSLKEIERCMREGPEDGEVLNAYGHINYGLKNYKLAIESLEKARKLLVTSPDNLDNLTLLGAVYFGFGQTQNAIRIWETQLQNEMRKYAYYGTTVDLFIAYFKDGQIDKACEKINIADTIFNRYQIKELNNTIRNFPRAIIILGKERLISLRKSKILIDYFHYLISVNSVQYTQADANIVDELQVNLLSNLIATEATGVNEKPVIKFVSRLLASADV